MCTTARSLPRTAAAPPPQSTPQPTPVAPARPTSGATPAAVAGGSAALPSRGCSRHRSDDDNDDGGEAEDHYHYRSNDEDEDGYHDDDDGEDEGDDDEGFPQAARPSGRSGTLPPPLSDDAAQALHALFVEVCTTYRASQVHSTKSTPPIAPNPARVSALVSRVYDLSAVSNGKSATLPVPVAASAQASGKAPKARSRSKQRKKDVTCEVCYEPIVSVAVGTADERKAGDGAEVALTMPTCGHDRVCNTCLAAYLTSRISSNDVAAWIPCPHPDCSAPIPPAVLVHPGLLPPNVLLLLLQSFLIKSLSRSTAFLPCTTSLCPYAFLSLSSAEVRLTCPLCHQAQSVQRGKQPPLDPSFQAMVNAGTLRGCPACNHWTMKEKGICNVLECAKCGVSAPTHASHIHAHNATTPVGSTLTSPVWFVRVCRCGGIGRRGRWAVRATS